jgi:hypothetical protein
MAKDERTVVSAGPQEKEETLGGGNGALFGVERDIWNDLPDIKLGEMEGIQPKSDSLGSTTPILPAWAIPKGETGERYGLKMTGANSAAYGRYEQSRTDPNFWKPGSTTLEISIFQGDITECSGHNDNRWTVLYYENTEAPPGESLLRMLRDQFGGGAFRLRFIDNLKQKNNIKDSLILEVESYMRRADANIALSLLEHQRLDRQQEKEEKLSTDRMAFQMQNQILQTLQSQVSEKDKAIQEAIKSGQAKQEESMAVSIMRQQMEQAREEKKLATQEVGSQTQFFLQWMTMQQEQEKNRQLELEKIRKEDERSRREEEARRWQLYQQQQMQQMQYLQNNDDDDDDSKDKWMMMFMQMSKESEARQLQSQQFAMQMQQQSRSDFMGLISALAPIVVPLVAGKKEDPEERMAKTMALLNNMQTKNDPMLAMLNQQVIESQRRADMFQSELLRNLQESKRTDSPMGQIAQFKQLAEGMSAIKNAFGGEDEEKKETEGVSSIVGNLLNSNSVANLVGAFAQRISTPAPPPQQPPQDSRNLRQSRIPSPQQMMPPGYPPQQMMPPGYPPQQMMPPGYPPQQMMPPGYPPQQMLQNPNAAIPPQPPPMPQQMPQPNPMMPQQMPPQPPPIPNGAIPGISTATPFSTSPFASSTFPSGIIPPSAQNVPEHLLERPSQEKWVTEKETIEQQSRAQKLNNRASFDPRVNELLDAIESSVVSKSPEEFVNSLKTEEKILIRMQMPNSADAVDFIKNNAGTPNIESMRGVQWVRRAVALMYS